MKGVAVNLSVCVCFVCVKERTRYRKKVASGEIRHELARITPTYKIHTFNTVHSTCQNTS